MRPEHMDVVGSKEHVGIFLDGLLKKALPVRNAYLWRPQLRDANYEMVLETAINGGADALVTFNVRDFQPAARMFGLDVLVPAEILRRILCP